MAWVVVGIRKRRGGSRRVGGRGGSGILPGSARKF